MKGPFDPVEGFPAEAELAACLGDGIFVDLMGAQHLVFDLRQVAGIEKLRLEEVGAHGFGVRVERTGSQEGLFLGRRGHGRKMLIIKKHICQAITAHKNFQINLLPY